MTLTSKILPSHQVHRLEALTANLPSNQVQVGTYIFEKNILLFIYFLKSIFLAICQIRLDFDTVVLGDPSTTTGAIGECSGDSLTVTSPSSYYITPLCGTLSGTHSKYSNNMYVVINVYYFC